MCLPKFQELKNQQTKGAIMYEEIEEYELAMQLEYEDLIKYGEGE